MADTNKLIKITLETVSTASGPMGLRSGRDEAICLHYEAGRIYIRRSAVLKAGSSWQKLKARLYDEAGRTGMEVADNRLP